MKTQIDLSKLMLMGDATMEPCEEGYLATFPEKGGRLIIAGQPMNLAGVSWEGATHLVMEITGLEEFDLALVWYFATGRTPDAPAVTVCSGVLPGIRTMLSFPLSALDSSKMTMPRTPGRVKQIVLGKGIELENVIGITITPKECHKPQKAIIHDLYLTCGEPEYSIDNPPVLDKLGQYKNREWQGKTKSEEEMVQQLEKEYDRYKEDLSYEGWSRFGGDLSVKWEGTGFFRTHYDGKRWYLVDPDGYRFISTGLDCCIPGEIGYISDIECLHDELPDEKTFADAYEEPFEYNRDCKGDFLSFQIVNLMKAYGTDWKNKWMKLTRNRLVDWRMNTIGNWSNLEFIRSAKLPYVWPLENFPTTETKIFRDFPDVYSEEYASNSVKFGQQLTKFKGDPYMIGYFLRNEPEWAFVENLLIAEKLLENPENTSSKQVFISELKDKYKNIDALNLAWNKEFKSFDDLQKSQKDAASYSEKAKQDIYDFSVKMITRYVALPSTECRKVDPDHMNLGMRYAMLIDPILLSGYENFDVFSINCYYVDSYDMVEQAGKITNKPIIVGEFHFGALDVGMLAAGICSVMTQKDRGLAYQVYYERSMKSQYFVGSHFFQYNDQATLGRFDGENTQIGFVDVCNKPYDTFINEVRSTNASIYDMADGKFTEPEPAVNRIPRLMGF